MDRENQIQLFGIALMVVLLEMQKHHFLIF